MRARLATCSRFLAAFLILALYASPVWAQTAPGEIFTRHGHADLALSWLKALFRGEALGDDASGSAFAQITESIRHILGLYSVGMLVLAGFLLLYYALVFITQTAHEGRIAWGEKNKMWAPLRFALVMGLLVPVGGGLNLGQYIIVKLTEQSSALASNAWQSAAETMKDSFTGLVTPRAPDMRPVTMRAVESAMCRAIYRRVYTALLPDDTLASLGSMTDFERTPADRLSGETWRYANKLQTTPALCGAYRFLAPSSASANASSSNEKNGATDPLLPILGDAARASAERLSLQASAFGETMADSFLRADADKDDMPDTKGVFTKLLHDQTALLQARIDSLATAKTKAENDLLASTQESGWISAGWLLLDLMDRQSLLGSDAEKAAPAIDPPLLGHNLLNATKIETQIQADSGLHIVEGSKLAKLYVLYEKAGQGMKKARTWIYQEGMDDPEFIPASSLDLADRLGEGTDSENGYDVYRRVLDSGFASFGVWGRAPSAEQTVGALTLSDEMKNKPMAALAEMGRRYIGLGTWVMGTLSQGFATPNLIVSTALYVGVGGLLALAGLGLLYLVPLIPLFRFVAGVLTWLLLVFEAVASVPLVAIAHMNPSGAGLASETAKRAYGLWLSVLIRPFLIIFGFLVGWAGFFLGLLFLNDSFTSLANQLAVVQADSLVGMRTLTALLYALLVLMVTNIAFKGISFFPDRAIEWIGGMVQSAGTQIEAVIPTHGPATGNAGETNVSGAQTFAAVVGVAGAGQSSGKDGGTGAHNLGGMRPTAGSAGHSYARDNQLFPQYKEKEIPSPFSAQSGDGKASASAAEGKGSHAAAGARVIEKQGAVAIATARASVVIDPSGVNALSDLAREAKEIILGETPPESTDKQKDPHESIPQDLVLKEEESKDKE